MARNPKQSDLIMDRELKRYFSEEDTQMANKYIKGAQHH